MEPSAYSNEDFLRQLLSKAIAASASDVHLKVGQPPGARVRGSMVYFRVDSIKPADTEAVVRKANDRITLNYRLINEGGTWKVYDVVIEGVSMVSNYRSQFSRIIHESGYAELVKRLKTKVSELTQAG